MPQYGWPACGRPLAEPDLDSLSRRAPAFCICENRRNLRMNLRRMNSSHPWISAADAARLLGVNRATLYAYVSRGFVRSQAAPGSTRERTYSRDDVERLRQRTEERRAPDKAAARPALGHADPGVVDRADRRPPPLLPWARRDDARTLAIARGGRGVDLDWRLRNHHRIRNGSTVTRPKRRLPFTARAQSMLAVAAAGDHAAFDLRAQSVAVNGTRILRLLTSAATRFRIRRERRLMQGWRGRGKPAAGGAEVLRAALVLCTTTN